MKALGIVYGHDSSVALVEDGTCVFAQAEERLARKKHVAGMPKLTLEYLYANIADRASIDCAVIYQRSLTGYRALRRGGFINAPVNEELVRNSAQRSLLSRMRRTRPAFALSDWRLRRAEAREKDRPRAIKYFAGELGLQPDQILFAEHHACHSFSVLPNLPNDRETLIFTLDGEGDGLSATVNVANGSDIRRVSATSWTASLGFFYVDTVEILGMRGLEDEFKVMGLAPYARAASYEPIVRELRELLTLDADGKFVSKVLPNARFRRLADVYRYCRFDDVAGAIQALTEELIEAWVKYWIHRTGCPDVAVTGGVFLNIKASKRVAELPEVRSLFVMPAAGDESCAIGAACWGTLQRNPEIKLSPLRDLYLGQSFTEEQLRAACEEAAATGHFDVLRPDDIDVTVAELLASNKIVARFSGRMEFGARALGNRSILANPSDYRNIARINDAIKGRDFWMPFAPSILEEEMPRYCVGAEHMYAPYMNLAFDGTPAAMQDLVAAIHPKDGTLRPQAVRASWNPAYHRLIAEFRRCTGIGGVLNTSFNLHGEPIVGTPADAVRTVQRSDLRYLALGPFLLSKR